MSVSFIEEKVGKYTLSIDSRSRSRASTRDPENVRLSGIETPPGVKIVHETDDILVLKTPGYRFNPGSRYSGLLTYVPPEITVYLKHDGWCYPITAWDVGRKKGGPKTYRK